DVAIYGDRFAFFPMRQWHGVRAKTIALKLLKASDAQVILWGRALYNDVEIDMRTTVEFDGCVRCDVRVNPNTHYVTKFALVVPLQRRWVKFVYHWPPGFPHIDNAFPLPSSGWQSSFRHYVWLGRDDGGIAWFTESEQPFVKGRASGDEHRVIEALVLDNAVELRINFVRHATMPTFREWTVTFGIMPTPVKPWRGDYHSRFVGIDAIYGMERAMFSVGSTISYPASDINIARGTIEMWLRMCFDTLHNDAFIMRLVHPRMLMEMFLEWRSKLAGNMGAGLRLRVMEQRRKELLCMRVPLKWRRGEWHHLALTWGDAIRIYADGKLMAERKFTGLFGGRPGWDRYGSLLLGGSAVTIDVDELRISQIARTQFELMKPPVVDAHTLLLDRMECRDERTPIRRTKVEMGQGGLLSELAQFCDGKFGGALRLYGRKYDHTALEHFARLGIHAVNLPEWWTHAQGTTETIHEQLLKRFVQEAHKHRIKVLLYFGFEMSDAANEWRWLKHELAGIKPKARTQLRIRSLSPPQTYFAIDHGAQPYQDYLIGGIVHLMRKYDIDGVYLDGTHLAGGCANPYHGHRWYDERGNVHKTSYIWSSRRLMKRLYRIMKAFKRDSVIFAHTSSALLAPTLS
ncbi:MAG TPA: hypothetical protein EYP10_05955, partial [Armatimonadetes bacterium]|nr:hypothetical protein [Armatimonadota bacterium]